MYEPFSMS